MRRRLAPGVALVKARALVRNSQRGGTTRLAFVDIRRRRGAAGRRSCTRRDIRFGSPQRWKRGKYRVRCKFRMCLTRLPGLEFDGNCPGAKPGRVKVTVNGSYVPAIVAG